MELFNDRGRKITMEDYNLKEIIKVYSSIKRLEKRLNCETLDKLYYEFDWKSKDNPSIEELKRYLAELKSYCLVNNIRFYC